MSHFDAANTIFQKAVAFVTQTNRHLFLTGKAGTGKTTFLKYIRNNSIKKTAIVAPTGVAAINAGGVTIHSFFQLPMGTYLPTRQGNWDTFDSAVNNQNTLFKNLRLSAPKRELMQELELLIIDEVSMVRADTLDAIDAVLRNVRQQPLVPFGGVQMLYIGDLFQLPPVVRPDEWRLLQDFYRSPFFFDALSLRESQPVYIELRKIYRQSDSGFISILNNIRNNCCTPADMQQLHEYYQPDFSPKPEENFITLTSHNDKADAINRNELYKLPHRLHTYNAAISGEFNERSYPAEEALQLKTGAQIMFIKNDKGENRRYYNGKIGVISSIDEEQGIMVNFPGEPEALKLETEKWQNIRYRYNKEKDKFEEEELGTFTQYPIRLAWAITIHKSQGLTFEKAIIDAGASFAPGQVYVALSRLTSLQGLVLRSRINADAIRTDERVLQFVQGELSDHVLQETLQTEQISFVKASLVKKFNWNKISNIADRHFEGYDEWKLFNKHTCMNWAGALVRAANAQNEVAVKFQRQLEMLLNTGQEDGYVKLHQRMEAAVQYFLKELDDNLLDPVNKHMYEVNNWPKIKKYLGALRELKDLFERKRREILQALEMTKALQSADGLQELLKLEEFNQKPVMEVIDDKPVQPKKSKAPKGETNRISLQMYKEGKSIADIAQERGLVLSTIESHLASFIPTGEVDVLELVTKDKLDKIIEILEGQPQITSTAIKQLLNDTVSYGEIKAAIKYFEKLNPVSASPDEDS